MKDWAEKNYKRNFNRELPGMKDQELAPIGIMDVVGAVAGLIAGMVAAAGLLVIIYSLTLA